MRIAHVKKLVATVCWTRTCAGAVGGGLRHGADRRLPLLRSHGLEPVLDLGRTPLADRLLTRASSRSPSPSIPCRSSSARMRSAADLTRRSLPRSCSARTTRISPLSPIFCCATPGKRPGADRVPWPGSGSLAVELASNDGYLLKNYVEQGVPCSASTRRRARRGRPRRSA